jgi:hypothetical protein
MSLRGAFILIFMLYSIRLSISSPKALTTASALSSGTPISVNARNKRNFIKSPKGTGNNREITLERVNLPAWLIARKVANYMKLKGVHIMRTTNFLYARTKLGNSLASPRTHPTIP